MGKLPSLQALKQTLKRLLGKTPDGNTDLEKSWKRQQNSQAQVYEELFSSEISSVLRHWERKGGLEFRDDFQSYKNCNDQEGMKWSPGSSPPPPLPPRSNAHGIAHPLTAHQEDIFDVGNSGGHRSNPSGGLPIMGCNNDKKNIIVNKNWMNYNVCKKQTPDCYPKPRLQVHKRKGFARKTIRFVVWNQNVIVISCSIKIYIYPLILFSRSPYSKNSPIFKADLKKAMAWLQVHLVPFWWCASPILGSTGLVGEWYAAGKWRRLEAKGYSSYSGGLFTC